jgi:uncharacterized protein
MFITIRELEARPVEFDESFQPEAIDFGPDYRQKEPLTTAGRAELIREHRGGKDIVEDIRLVGRISTEIEMLCARCLEPVDRSVDRDFDLLYRPLGVDRRRDEVSINQAETEISYYQGDGLLLEDVLREQVLLALPMKEVCRESCKGLCPHCGRNLNSDACDCAEALADPRWSALKEWKEQRE